MIRPGHLAALGLVIGLATDARAAETFDLIPADALGGVACRSIEGLVKKSEQLAKDADIKLPEQPGELCKQVFQFLGIRTGLDLKGGCSLVVVNKTHIGAEIGFQNLESFLVAAIPFTEIDALGENFGLGKGKLKPETITPLEGRREFGKLAYVKGKHLFLGANEKAILSVANGKTVGGDLSPAVRKRVAEADCLGHIGTEVWGDIRKEILKGVEDVFDHLKDDAERRTARELVETLGAVQHLLCTCRLEGGFGCSCYCVLPKEGQETARKFLTTLRGGDGASSLDGLPPGNIIAATAARGDGSQNSLIARVLIDVVLRDVLESNRVFGAADRPAVLAVFNEIWPSLRGSRFALYKTADEQKLGLFSAAGILDVEDPEQFLTQLKTLAKLGSADGLDFSTEAGKEKTEAEIEMLIKDLGNRRFPVRESAQSKLLLAGEQVLPYVEKGLKSTDLEVARRCERIKTEIVQAAEDRRKELLSGDLTRAVKPSFVFLDKTEMVEGFEVYNVGVKLSKRDAATAPQFRQLLGPDWARVRIGVQGKQVVILAGSDVKLLGEAMRNLKDGKPGLAAADTLAGQAKSIDAGRKVEMHVSLALAAALATAADLKMPGQLPMNPALTTAALTVEEDRLQCELWMPVAELKAIAKSVR